MSNDKTEDQRLEEIAELFDKVNKNDVLLRHTREAYKEELEKMTKEQIVMHAIQQTEVIHKMNMHLVDVRGKVTDFADEINDSILDTLYETTQNKKVVIEFKQNGISVQKQDSSNDESEEGEYNE